MHGRMKYCTYKNNLNDYMSPISFLELSLRYVTYIPYIHTEHTKRTEQPSVSTEFTCCTDSLTVGPVRVNPQVPVEHSSRLTADAAQPERQLQ